MDPDMTGIIIDNGSGLMKCGFSGSDAPSVVFPTIIGVPKESGVMLEGNVCPACPAEPSKRGVLKLKRPIEYGMVTNWNGMEKIWHHTFYHELKVTPEEHPVLLAEAPLNPNNNREKMVSIIFERFNVPGLYLGVSEVLALYASGRTTGLMFGCGHGVSHAVPVYEGLPLTHNIRRMNISGVDITDNLVKTLNEAGYEIQTTAEREIVRDMKEKHGYVALDYESEMEKYENSAHCKLEYELPDGTKMTLGNQRFRAPEILFKPSLIGSEMPGIHEMIYSTIQSSDIDIRKDFYQNIVLTGGSTMFEGIVERLSNDVQFLGPKHARIKVNAPAERKFSVWIGGSILSSLSTFQNQWITKDMYDDHGATIVHRKCI